MTDDGTTFYHDLKRALLELGIGPEYRAMIYGAVEETIAQHLVNGTLLIRGWMKVTTYAKVQEVRNVATGLPFGEQIVVSARAKVGARLTKALREKYREEQRR